MTTGILLKGWALIALICAALTLSAHAVPGDLTAQKIAEIDRFVEQRMEEIAIPGVAIALISEGEIVHTKGFGVSGPDGAPVTPDSIFEVGSVTKSFTAVAILQLVDAGLITLDDPVVKHIPWFGTQDTAQSAKITIRHLLAHQSGLSSYFGNRNQDGVSNKSDALEVAVRGIGDTQLISEPGTVFAYSNANYQTLGLIIENITGEPFEDIVSIRVLQAGNFPNASMGPLPQIGAVTGHRYWYGQPKPYNSQIGRAAGPQGGVNASITDLAAYLQTYMGAAEPLMSDASMTAAITPYDAEAEWPYALGWFVREYDTHTLIYHTGANAGFSALLGFSPDQNFGYAVLMNANASFGMRDVERLSLGVSDILMNEPTKPAHPSLAQRGVAALLLAAPLLILLSIFRFMWRRRVQSFKPVDFKNRPVATTIRAALPTVFLFAIAYALLIIVPHATNAPMSAISLFNPDIALSLTTGGYLALLWGIVRPVLRLTTKSDAYYG